MSKDFGLGNDEPTTVPAGPTVATDLISGLRPRIAARPQISVTESDEAAKRAGFTSREPKENRPVPVSYTRPMRQKRKQEITFPLSMRAPQSILERFIAYAEKHKLSYPLALEKLLDDSDKLNR